MQIEDIKHTIACQVHALPFKIIAAVLYGSFARGSSTQDSDVDILFVSDEVNPKKHRRGKDIARIKERLSLEHPMDMLLLTSSECLSNFRNHNPLFLDIAWEGIILLDANNFLKTLIDETRSYISEKYIRKLTDGWIFPVPERTPAFLSKVSNRDFALAMIRDGARDFAIGLNIMEDGFYDKAVYHFQQSAEKSIKAVLICFGIFKKTHFVGEILVKELDSRTIEMNWKEKLVLIAKISSEVEPEVTWSRYPGIDDDVLWIPSEEYTIEDTRSIKDKCEKVIKTAQAFLAWWFPADKQ
jgi:HEPN domain-containing protein/predicted nucleotidyltransferase